jgi:hypothetical protein
LAKHYETDSGKTIVVAGPTFGEALRFMILGAALGAGAVYFLLERNGGTANMEDAVTEGLTAGGAKPGRKKSLIRRIFNVLERTRAVSERMRELAGTVQEAASPIVKQAVEQGKQAAAEVESRLRKEVSEAGDRPYLAEQDEELPSQTEEKFVE